MAKLTEKEIQARQKALKEKELESFASLDTGKTNKEPEQTKEELLAYSPERPVNLLEVPLGSFLGNDVEVIISHSNKSVGVTVKSKVNSDLGECSTFISGVEIGLSDTDEIKGITQKLQKDVGILSDRTEVTFEVPYYGTVYIITEVTFTDIDTGDRTKTLKVNKYEITTGDSFT